MKQEALPAHGRVVLASRQATVATRPSPSPTRPTRARAAFFVGGKRTPWVSSGGEFSAFTFVRSLPDIDWVAGGGAGVSLDLALPIDDVAGIERVLNELAALGQTSGEGHWSIQQMRTIWHGMGAAGLLAALRGWQSRYRNEEALHHTEDFLYADACDGGFYTFSAGVAARSDRRVWHPYVSLQLRGIPLNSDPLRHLCEAVGMEGEPYFRPRMAKSVESMPLSGFRAHVGSPTALIVDTDPSIGGKYRQWVVGIVVANPYYDSTRPHRKVPDGAPAALGASELLVCDLRSHHPISEPPASYTLTDAEWAWSSEGLVLRVRADWDGPALLNPRAPHRTAQIRPKRRVALSQS